MRYVNPMLTKDEARAALKALEMTRPELGVALGAMTGKKYSIYTIGAWLAPNGRAIPDVLQVYLQMQMRLDQA